jgi:dynein light chain Tctex-type 1
LQTEIQNSKTLLLVFLHAKLVISFSKALTATLDGKVYAVSKVSEYIDAIGASTLGELKLISSNFKYVVSCVIVQNVGAGLHYESVAHWDQSTDGSIIVKYENQDLVGICVVMAIAI